MSDHDHAIALLALAERDLRALRAMGDDAAFADEIVGFHAQQAVEKALKAWLAAGGHAYDRTHDLSVLLGALAEAGHQVGPFQELVRLNVFAVRFRYEALGPGVPLPDRSQVADNVAALIEQVGTEIST